MLNRGDKCLIRLVVSLHSLRKHYQGAVTLFADGEHDDDFLASLKDTFMIDVIHQKQRSDSITLLKKMEICKESPYDSTIFMDSDTIVVKDFSELFEYTEDYEMVITRFVDWKSWGGVISNRIKCYEPYKPEYIQAAIDFGPAVNTGVFAWKSGGKMLDEWIEITKLGAGNMFIPDEIACQLLIPRYNVKIADSKFNVSAKYEKNDDARIIHFHGNKHCSKSPQANIWLNEYIEVLEKNLCFIKSLSAKNKIKDKRLRKFLYENNEQSNVELKRKIVSLIPHKHL